MRWPIFILFAYVFVGLQMAAGSAFRVYGATPNLLLLLLIFIALHAPAQVTLVAAMMIGIGHDLISAEPFGFHAIVYTIVGSIMAQMKQFMYREHPLSHIAMSLLGVLMLGLGVWMIGWLRSWIYTPQLSAPGDWGATFGSLIFTVLLAPVLIYLLRQTRRMFSFKKVEFSE